MLDLAARLGTVSAFSLSIEYALYAVSCFLVLIVLMALSNNSRIRYYGCYIFYIVYTALALLFFLLIYMWRPRNVVNLTISGYFLRHYTKVLGIKWIFKNSHIIAEKKGAVVVANHQSILDIMGMFNLWPIMGKCTAAGKKELLFIPPFGPMAWLAGLIYIDRNNPQKAIEELQKSSNLIKNEKTKLWIFPEGTRNKNGETFLPFKKGAFRTAIDCEAPIIPVVFSPYYFINGNKKTFDRGEIVISILEPIQTTGCTVKDVEEIMTRTHKAMSAEYAILKAEANIKSKLLL